MEKWPPEGMKKESDDHHLLICGEHVGQSRIEGIKGWATAEGEVEVEGREVLVAVHKECYLRLAPDARDALLEDRCERRGGRRMTEHRKPPFKWEPRQPRADDPMFGRTHVAAVSFPVQPKHRPTSGPGGK